MTVDRARSDENNRTFGSGGSGSRITTEIEVCWYPVQLCLFVM